MMTIIGIPIWQIYDKSNMKNQCNSFKTVIEILERVDKTHDDIMMGDLNCRKIEFKNRAYYITKIKKIYHTE